MTRHVKVYNHDCQEAFHHHHCNYRSLLGLRQKTAHNTEHNLQTMLMSLSRQFVICFYVDVRPINLSLSFIVTVITNTTIPKAKS